MLKYQTSNREKDGKDVQQEQNEKETDVVKNQRHRRYDSKKR